MTGQARALKGEEALCMSNFACTAASRTRLRLGTGLGAASRASLARHRGWNADLRRFAGESLIEADFHIVPQVGAALAARTTAASACHAEDAFKNVSEGRSEIGAESVSGAAHAVLEGSMAETVIGGAFITILEHIVGLVNLLESILAILVAWITIRMMLHGEFAKGRLELDLRAVAAHTQDFIIISLGHPASALYFTVPSQPYLFSCPRRLQKCTPRTHARG